MNISGIGPSFGGFTYNPIKLNTDFRAAGSDDATAVAKTSRVQQNVPGVQYSQYNAEGSVRLKPGSADATSTAVRGAENFDF